MLTSAIHYPHSSITDVNTMKRALLLWDKYNVIGPWQGFSPEHDGVIAEAFAEIGGVVVPEPREQQLAHDEIVSFLNLKDKLDHRFFLRQRGGHGESHRVPSDIYEVYPQKLLGPTWDALIEAGFAGRDLLPDADRPMTPWGGLLIMAKLADACAGKAFARVTDRVDAYRVIANETFRPDFRLPPGEREDEASVVPILLSLIDATSIPIANLMRFRADERDPSLRHSMLARISSHIETLRQATSFNQITMIKEQFEKDMRLDLKQLRDALRTNKIRFVCAFRPYRRVCDCG